MRYALNRLQVLLSITTKQYLVTGIYMNAYGLVFSKTTFTRYSVKVANTKSCIIKLITAQFSMLRQLLSIALEYQQA